MIRVAILGAGIGREHLAAYRALPGFEVVAVVDLDPARIEEIRAPDDSFHAETEMQAVMDDPSINLIDVCLPPHLHVPVTVQALEASKDVICEKPLATSLADCARLEAAAQATGKRVFPVFQYRWGPSHAQLRHLIDAGLTGAPQVAALETHWNRGAPYYAVPWRGTWAGERGGAVLGHAIHNHDLLCHFLGPVAEVSAMTATRVNPIETEDCAAISLRMSNGALATSSITLGAAFDRTRLQIVFENLTATSGTAPYAPGMDAWTFTARDPANQPAVDAAVANAPPEPIGFAGFLAQVALALTGQPNRAVTLAEGVQSVALVTAIYHAARTGERVPLPLPANHPLFETWQPT